MRRTLTLMKPLFRKLNFCPYAQHNSTISNLRLTISVCILLAFLFSSIMRFSNYPLALRLINVGILALLIITSSKLSLRKIFIKHTQVMFSVVVLLGTHLSIAGLTILGPFHGLAVDYFASIIFFLTLIPIVSGLTLLSTFSCGVITLITFNFVFPYATNSQALFCNLILIALTMIACMLVQMLSVLGKRDRIQTLYRQREISNMKRKNDQLRCSDTARNKLLYLISHDLRGPIASIKGIINLYSANVLSPDEFRCQAAKLNDLLRDTNTTLDNLLYWSILENEKTLNHTVCNIYEMTEAIFVSMEKRAQLKNILLENHIPMELLMRVDAALMHLTLNNVLSNAIKFSDAGSITIQVYFSAESICFEIIDTGHGMENHEVEKLFDWDRINNSSGTHVERGPGLGLLLCKQFMQHHNGDLLVRSEKNKGTTVTINLPTALIVPVIRKPTKPTSQHDADTFTFAKLQTAT